MISLRHRDDVESSFLTSDEIPANKSFKKEEFVRVLVPRVVIRSGYRYSAADFRERAIQLVNKNGAAWFSAIDAADSAFNQETARAPRKMSNAVYNRFLNFVAAVLCEKAGFGGPERGLHVQSLDLSTPQTCKVLGFARFQVGTRYAPSWYTDRDVGIEEYEPGGLENRRTIVALETTWGNFLSGDCEKG